MRADPIRLVLAGRGAALCLALLLTAPGGELRAATLTTTPFGTTRDSTPVTRHTMVAASGVSVTFMSYGAAVTDVTAPDRQGRPGHVVLGFPTLRDYETKGAEGGFYFGAILERYANWINRGRFTLDRQEHQVSLAYPPHAIHGGKRGFDKRVWAVQPQATSGGSVSARLTYTSPDGEEGFLGTLRVAVTYALSDDGAFTIRYEATTDRATVFTLSNHMSFNLAGAGSPGGVLGQVLTVDADSYLPLDRSQLPLGQLAPLPAPHSTSGRRSRSAPASVTRTSSSPSRTATTSTGRWTSGAIPRGRSSPRAPTIPKAAARWSAGLPSRACRSTQPASSTGPTAAPGAATTSTPHSRWKLTTTPTARIIPLSRRRNLGRDRCSAARRCSASACKGSCPSDEP